MRKDPSPPITQDLRSGQDRRRCHESQFIPCSVYSHKYSSIISPTLGDLYHSNRPSFVSIQPKRASNNRIILRKKSHVFQLVSYFFFLVWISSVGLLSVSLRSCSFSWMSKVAYPTPPSMPTLRTRSRPSSSTLTYCTAHSFNRVISSNLFSDLFHTDPRTSGALRHTPLPRNVRFITGRCL